MVMANQSLTIAQAARSMGVSTRTVRRYIKSGKLDAQFIQGNHGSEFRISAIPPELIKGKTLDKERGWTMDTIQGLLHELQQQNLQLAAQLGAASERIHALENQVKLLTAGKQPWWRRLFKRPPKMSP
jgi:excisionase family DNA binding protein